MVALGLSLFPHTHTALVFVTFNSLQCFCVVVQGKVSLDDAHSLPGDMKTIR